jgi:hypothetical protein
VRVNDQCRIVFRFEGTDALDVRCTDYHAIVRGRRGVSADTALLFEALTHWDAEIGEEYVVLPQRIHALSVHERRIEPLPRGCRCLRASFTGATLAVDRSRRPSSLRRSAIRSATRCG